MTGAQIMDGGWSFAFDSNWGHFFAPLRLCVSLFSSGRGLTQSRKDAKLSRSTMGRLMIDDLRLMIEPCGMRPINLRLRKIEGGEGVLQIANVKLIIAAVIPRRARWRASFRSARLIIEQIRGGGI
jgi:hypothetical protein